ncbi:acetylcholinesterase-like isoform X4 [Dermatophagoides pteronyssinus]|nr:acetylcholinesterase-like isoform X2 [Dermatophagoides pteronyssinus]
MFQRKRNGKKCHDGGIGVGGGCCEDDDNSSNDSNNNGSLSSLILRYFLLILIVGVIIYQAFNNYHVITYVSHSVKSFFRGDFDNIIGIVDDNYNNNNNSDDRKNNIYYVPGETEILRHMVIRTRLGRLRGFVQNVNNVEVQTFLSVPFGQPPIDKLRFRRTRPIRKWTGIKDATEFPSPCIQSEYTQRLFPVHIINQNVSEDCLYLNIWSPLGSRNKSVMVMIHGGLFTIGSISVDEYDGRMLAAHGDVVVVTIQYRLGIFGFLDLDSERIPGNMGLFDQAMALKWIHDNIRYFGGNPNSITLFGTSAGSISIGFHMFSSHAQRLFQRAILQSGSPMLLKDAFLRGESVAEKFAEIIGCYEKGNQTIYEDPEPIIDCIDQTPFDQIYKAQDEIVQDNPVPFMPTIPSEYIESLIGDFNDSIKLFQKQVLMGFNLNEGALMLHLSYPKIYTRHDVPKHKLLKQVQKSVVTMGVDSGLKESTATAMANLLIRSDHEEDNPIVWARKVADLFSDVMF